jgi:L-malate glycosyltransferase
VAATLRALARRTEFSLLAIILNEGRLADEVRIAGVEVRVLPENQMGFGRLVSEATQFLRGRGVAILHSHRYKENILAALVARRCRIPFVVRTVHGRPEPARGLAKWKHGLIECANGWVERFATDRVICVSKDLSRAQVRRADKFVVIPNGIDLKQVRSNLDTGEAKRRLGLARDALVLGTAGRLERVKRLDIFLGAAKLVSARLPQARFVIAGSGSEEAHLRDLARRAGLGDRVMFLGQRDDIYDVLRAFDTLVLSSDHEGLPTVLLEALWLGIPVVARALGGIPEVVEDGKTGVLVRSDDPSVLAAACVGLLGDEARRRELAHHGARVVETAFSIEQTSAQLARLYSSLATAPVLPSPSGDAA